MTQTIRTAVIGTRFMGRAHAAGIDDLNRFFDLEKKVEKAVLCGTDEAHTLEAAQALGFAESCTDFQSLITRDDIDAIHICTPVSAHFSSAWRRCFAKNTSFAKSR